MDAFAAATADRWLTGATGPEARARLFEMIAVTPFEGFRACATALMNYDYADELARIVCPTLLVVGAQDGAMPEGMATKLKPAIARSEMHVIDEAGHIPCFEQPDAFTAILSRFLETTCGKIAT
jgi:3-oxoadipate enol-lactonase